MDTVNTIVERAVLALRDEWRRTVVAFTAAALLYVAAVGFDAYIYGWITLVALPCALVLIWFLTRPQVAMALSAVAILMMLLTDYGGRSPGVGMVLAQSTILCTIFGVTISDKTMIRPLLVTLIAAFVVVVTFRSESIALGLVVLVLCLAAVVGGLLWRQFADRLTNVTSGLAESQAQAQEIKRDVAVEQERNRIAREVHDVVAHSLAVVIAQADGARYAATANPESVGPALETIAETARGALGEVRVLLQNLRHEQGTAPTPGTADIDPLLDGMRDLGLTIETVTYGHERALGDATQLAVYRVVQEALTNALRHGDTTQPVGLDFDWGDHGVTIVITNTLNADGVPQLDGPGHGIPGMRERAALAGGELTVGVGNRGLFRVRATLPAPVAPNAPTVATALPVPVPVHA